MVQNYGTTQQVTLVDTVGNPVNLVDINSSGVKEATEAKQDDQINLLQQSLKQLFFLNRIGTALPTRAITVTATITELFPASGTRKAFTITNHSTINNLIVALNTNAALNLGKIVAPEQTYESSSIAEARSRVTAISLGGDIPVSLDESADSVFLIGELTITNQVADIADVNYSIEIVGATKPLASVQANLYEENNLNPIATTTINSGLTPGANFVVTFNSVSVLDGNNPKNFYLELIGGD